MKRGISNLWFPFYSKVIYHNISTLFQSSPLEYRLFGIVQDFDACGNWASSQASSWEEAPSSVTSRADHFCSDHCKFKSLQIQFPSYKYGQNFNSKIYFTIKLSMFNNKLSNLIGNEIESTSLIKTIPSLCKSKTKSEVERVEWSQDVTHIS